MVSISRNLLYMGKYAISRKTINGTLHYCVRQTTELGTEVITLQRRSVPVRETGIDSAFSNQLVADFDYIMRS